jgi:hypothetical protein
LKSAFPFNSSGPVRRIALAWRQGALVARFVCIGVIALLVILAASAWQGRRLQHRIDGLNTSAVRLRAALAAKSAVAQAAQSPDVVQTLPDAPAVAQVMQTLQQAADKEGARVESLQADDHPATDTALGHLDLTLSIKAPYPSTLVVLQQVLDRYPGATLKQFDMAQTVPAAAAMPMAPAVNGGAMAPAATTPSEARVLLSFWRRPQGVARDSLAAAAPVSAQMMQERGASAPSLPPSSAASLASLASTPGGRSSAGAR